MDLTKQYYMYRLAYYFMTEEKYNMLHINNEQDEVWLEKSEKKKTNIIRFIPHGFTWKNHLKSDIAKVFQRIKTIRKSFSGQQIMIYNIYVSDMEPVDDWESLKKTMILKDRKPLQMNVFYITDENSASEEERLFKKTNTVPIPKQELPDEASQKKDTSFYKTVFNQIVQRKDRQVRDTFSFGKPIMTYFFILLSLAMFFVLEIQGGSMDIEVLIRNGAKYNPAVADGDWWRLVTSIFMHIGFFHLFVNMAALYYVGMITERIYGSIRFSVIFLLAGIGGSLTSFTFNPSVSAGASGALFGLFGALLYFGFIHKRLFRQTMGKSVAIILILNLAIGLFLPQIDMGAHLGGLIFGFLTSAMVSLPNKRLVSLQILGAVSYMLIAAFLIFYSS